MTENMKKKTIVLSALLAGVLPVVADTYDYLTFQTTGGEQVSVAVENLSLTVDGGHLVATNGEGSQTFQLSDLAKMYFSSEPTAVTGVSQSATGKVKVYDTTGAPRGQYPSEADAIGRLSKGGVYIIKSEGETVKKVSR